MNQQRLSIPEAIQHACQRHQSGELEAAEQIYRDILKADPHNADALHLLGVLVQQKGDPAQALGWIRQAIAVMPNQPAFHINLGEVFRAMGEPQEAIPCYEAALKLDDNMAQAHFNMAHALQQLNQAEQAITSFHQALALDPTLLGAWNDLGNLHKRRGSLKEAITCYQKVLEQHPDHLETLYNLANTLSAAGELDEAARLFTRAIALKPGFFQAQCNLGHTLREMGRLDEAAEGLEQALTTRPDDPRILNNLGNARLALGELDQAVTCYNKALTLGRDFNMMKNLISAMLYHPGTRNDTLFETCRSQMRACQPTMQMATLSPPKGPIHGRMRIGYLSSDFRGHPVADNILPLLQHHDPQQVEIFAYVETAQSDAVTKELRRHVHHWRPTDGLSDEQAAEMIRQDGIHVMVYLAGLFDTNRLMIASHRPAPVQVSFHNGCTTAMDQMDFWISDALLHPPQATQERFSETLCRLPVFYTFPPPKETPDVGPLPVDNNGFITFISLNNPAKITAPTVHLWSEILTALPDARLILKYRNHLENESLRQRLFNQFSERDIHPERLEMISARDRHQHHLSLYNRADIALDPFPFTGATTTFQALWMGVPVISLLGDRFISRMAGDILFHAGLAELLADTPERYAENAAALAGNTTRLRTLRAGLRDQLKASPLLDGATYARHMEQAYRMMWNHQSG
ncbi:MAG: tetratricopeptide repeat protein [Magnetococcales bacterium]|nr:tetratricopeptide repeat protein [Magnetococcales bacterium]